MDGAPPEGTTLESLPDLVKVPELCRFFRASEPSIRAAIRNNELPSVRIGRLLYVPKHALAAKIGKPAGEPEE